MSEFPKNKPAQAYINYLNLSKLASRPPGFDVHIELVLHWLAAHWATGTPVTVVQAMHQIPGVSSTTVHRRMKFLREAGFIVLEMDEEDNRVKHVRPTDTAQAYFATMGKALMKAARASS